MNEPYQSSTYDEVEESGSKTVGLVIGLVVITIVAVVIVLMVKRAKPPLVPYPAAFTEYVSSDKSFQVAQPVGWTVDPSSSEGINSGVRFSSGNAKIDVDADLGGSLMADMAQAQNNQMENMASNAGVATPPPVPPVEKVHMAGKEDVENEYSNYSEMQMVEFQAPLGDGRVSEFTADGGTFVGPLHGYRATLLSNDKRITVVAVCPQNNWDTLKPAFIKEIASVDRAPQ